MGAATLEVLHAAIRHEGSTSSDGTYRNALNQDGGYQNAHRVYDRAEERCPTCAKGIIVRIVQAQAIDVLLPSLPVSRTAIGSFRSDAGKLRGVAKRIG